MVKSRGYHSIEDGGQRNWLQHLSDLRSRVGQSRAGKVADKIFITRLKTVGSGKDYKAFFLSPRATAIRAGKRFGDVSPSNNRAWDRLRKIGRVFQQQVLGRVDSFVTGTAQVVFELATLPIAFFVDTYNYMQYKASPYRDKKYTWTNLAKGMTWAISKPFRNMYRGIALTVVGPHSIVDHQGSKLSKRIVDIIPRPPTERVIKLEKLATDKKKDEIPEEVSTLGMIGQKAKLAYKTAGSATTTLNVYVGDVDTTDGRSVVQQILHDCPNLTQLTLRGKQSEFDLSTYKLTKADLKALEEHATKMGDKWEDPEYWNCE